MNHIKHTYVICLIGMFRGKYHVINCIACEGIVILRVLIICLSRDPTFIGNCRQLFVNTLSGMVGVHGWFDRGWCSWLVFMVGVIVVGVHGWCSRLIVHG